MLPLVADAAAPVQRRRIHGRRFGPGSGSAGRQRIAQGLATLGATLEPGRPLDPAALFPAGHDAVWLEIGFGGGEHLAALAAARPEIGFIGIEPFMTGVGKLLRACAEQDLTNVRVLAEDARLVLAALPARSIDRAFVLFPDPWPKTRHASRRLVEPATLAALARVLREGGTLRLATDDPAYARAMLGAVLRCPGLAWVAARADDWRRRPADQPLTRYEAKAAAAGRRAVFIEARRTGDIDAVVG